MAFIKNLKPIVLVWYRCVWQTGWRYVWLALVPAVVAVLQWLFNIRLLWDVLFSDNGLSFFNKLDVLFESVWAVFTGLTDWTPIAFVLIAVLQATAITLFITLRRKAQLSRKVTARQAASMGVAIVGAGCVACGGSLVTPLLGLLATNVSLALAESVSDLLLLVAVGLSVYALAKVVRAPYFKKVL